MATKRVILANNSRLLREMLRHVINKGDNLEVVQELLNQEEIPAAIERFAPAWVIASLPASNGKPGWINDCIADHPSVRFILLSSDNANIKMKWQASDEADLTNLSIKDFIYILEKDLQHT